MHALVSADDQSVIKGGSAGDFHVYKEDDKALIASAPEIRDMLLKLEWAPCDDGCGWVCQDCTAYKTPSVGEPRPGYGQHYPACALAVLLGRLR